MAEMKLEVWQGDWGLPSVDFESLTVMAYCKFAGAPVEIDTTSNPRTTPKGNFPVLHDKEAQMTSIRDIIHHLRRSNWGADFELTARQSADNLAFSSLLEQKLLPGLLHFLWIDTRNYSEVTHRWYAKRQPFPFNFFIPSHKQKNIKNRVLALKGKEHLTESELEAQLYKEAKECMNLLSQTLGRKDYFFGDKPSSLDALVFGYLAPILKMPLPNAVLQNHLKGCNNLCNFCHRVLNIYFPLSRAELEAQREKAEKEKKKHMESMEFPNKKRNMLIAGAVALIAMVGYAFLSGLIQIEITDVDNKYQSSEGEEGSSPDPPNFNQFENIFEEGEEDDAGDDED